MTWQAKPRSEKVDVLKSQFNQRCSVGKILFQWRFGNLMAWQETPGSEQADFLKSQFNQ